MLLCLLEHILRVSANSCPVDPEVVMLTRGEADILTDLRPTSCRSEPFTTHYMQVTNICMTEGVLGQEMLPVAQCRLESLDAWL